MASLKDLIDGDSYEALRLRGSPERKRTKATGARTRPALSPLAAAATVEVGRLEREVTALVAAACEHGRPRGRWELLEVAMRRADAVGRDLVQLRQARGGGRRFTDLRRRHWAACQQLSLLRRLAPGAHAIASDRAGLTVGGAKKPARPLPAVGSGPSHANYYDDPLSSK